MNEVNEDKRYLVGTEFAPESDAYLRGPPAVSLEFLFKFRWLNLRADNAQALQRIFDDITKEIDDLKQKIE
jgi:hypothetical protein